MSGAGRGIYQGTFQTRRKVGDWLVNIIVELSKYIIIAIIIMYTYLCFTILVIMTQRRKKGC